MLKRMILNKFNFLTAGELLDLGLCFERVPEVSVLSCINQFYRPLPPQVLGPFSAVMQLDPVIEINCVSSVISPSRALDDIDKETACALDLSLHQNIIVTTSINCYN